MTTSDDGSRPDSALTPPPPPEAGVLAWVGSGEAAGGGCW